MKLTFDESVERFRQSFIDWLEENAPAPEETSERARSSAHIPEWARRWQRKMFDDGWLLPGHPPEFGGRNAGLLEQFVYLEELARRRIYHSFNPQGLNIIVPSILTFGTDEQKQRWAVPVLRAEVTAALGMSEPDAGSDLAGLRTRATLDGDRFIVNGQKVWTSGAHDADFILTFVRTDPDAPKHKGLSCLIIPTDTDGVTCRPFRSFIGNEDFDFNEVFFDDVEVPSANLIGGLNHGWQVATGSLGHERAMLWLDFAERLQVHLESASETLDELDIGDDPLVLDGIGTMAIDLQALRLLGYRTLAKADKGMEAAEQSILKLFGSEASQAAALRILESMGPAGLDHTRRNREIGADPLSGDFHGDPWFDQYLRTFSGTIAGGTSQIQRNIVAERILGLPR